MFSSAHSIHAGGSCGDYILVGRVYKVVNCIRVGSTRNSTRESIFDSIECGLTGKINRLDLLVIRAEIESHEIPGE